MAFAGATPVEKERHEAPVDEIDNSFFCEAPGSHGFGARSPSSSRCTLRPGIVNAERDALDQDHPLFVGRTLPGFHEVTRKHPLDVRAIARPLLRRKQ